MFWDIVSVLMLLSAVTQLCYILYISNPSPRSGRTATGPIQPKTLLPVSVVICAHNEAAHLREHLPMILDQRYHDQNGRRAFEVIVVNDRSTDDTAAVLRTFSDDHDHLRIVSITEEEPRSLPGKKFALSRGLAAATYEHLLLTDADCAPVSPHWLRRMTDPFAEGKEIVAGYGGFREEDGPLNRFVRCETIFTFLQMQGMARRGRPYMAVGRNLAVRKSLLEAAQETELWKKMPSGDDDLIVRLFATKHNYVVENGPEAFTYSRAHRDLSAYLRQKQRHMSTGKLYRPSVKAILGMNGLSHSILWCLAPFWIAGLAAAEHPVVPPPVVGLALLLRCIAFYGLIAEGRRRLKEPRLNLFIPAFDLLLAAYSIILSPYILWKSRQRWK